MRHGHLRQAAHQQQSDQRTDGIADQHAGPGIADGVGAAHEQPGADGATDGDHAHLAGSELAPEAQFAIGDFGKALVWRGHVACPFIIVIALLFWLKHCPLWERACSRMRCASQYIRD